MLRKLLSILFLWAFQTQAVDIHVATPTQLATAIDQASPGYVIIMQDGTWTDTEILFDGQGQPGNPITLRAQTNGRVILKGSSRLRLAGQHLHVEGLLFKNGQQSSPVIEFRRSSSTLANNCRITQCAIIDYQPPLPGADTKWISIYGLSNRVDHCYFRGKRNRGTLLVVWLPENNPAPPNDHQVDHNYFGYRPDLEQNGGEIIRVGDSDTSFNVSRTVVEYNFFKRCNGEVEIISNKSCENIYRHNTFEECEGTLTLRHGNRCSVYGNYFLGNQKPSTGGVRIIGEDHAVYNNYFSGLMGSSARSALSIMRGLENSPLKGYFQVKRARVMFNTFVNCRYPFVIGLSDNLSGTTNITTLPPLDCAMANNVVVADNRTIVNLRHEPENMLWEGNLFYGGPTGLPQTNGITVIDPQLTPDRRNIWRPSAQSPVLGAAVGGYSEVNSDIDEQIRPPVKDIGCDQRITDTVPPGPLDALQVGPDWWQPVSHLNLIQTNLNTVTLICTANEEEDYAVEYSLELQTWIPINGVTLGGTNQTWLDDGTLTGGYPSIEGDKYYRLQYRP